MEIERKFLVANLPDHLDRFPHSHLEQGYLSVSPALRIRRHDDKYIFTFKNGDGLSREEFEAPLTEESFLHLKTKTDGNWIEKTRYFIPAEGGLTIELDVFHGSLAPLVYAEVEFPSEAAANAFIPPVWFGKDVTLLPEYQNSALSRNGSPIAKA